MSPAALATSPAVLFSAGVQARYGKTVAVRARYDADFGLIVVVTALPAGVFDASRLLGGIGPLLTVNGAALWNRLHELAHDCLAQGGKPGEDFAAVILDPDAIDAARTALIQQRAA